MNIGDPLRIIEVEPLWIPLPKPHRRRRSGPCANPSASPSRQSRSDEMPRRARDGAPLVAGPVVAWRAWALSGHEEMLRLRPVGRYARPWPLRRPVEAGCGHWRFHRAPSIGCTCGVHATREPELLRRARGPVVVGTVALWGTIVEHALGYRATYGYPLRLCLVCPICFWQLGAARSRTPVMVAALRREQSMPLCDEHLGTASAVGLSVRRLTPADEALGTLLDLYGVGEMSLLDATVGSAETVSGPRLRRA